MALEKLIPFPLISQSGSMATATLLPSHSFGQFTLVRPLSKKNITDGVNPEGEGGNNDMARPSPQNLLTMKLQQRLVVAQVQAQQWEEQLNEQNQQLNQQLEQLTQQQQVQVPLPTVHTDSGIRLIGEETLEEIDEVPPGYTEA